MRRSEVSISEMDSVNGLYSISHVAIQRDEALHTLLWLVSTLIMVLKPAPFGIDLFREKAEEACLFCVVANRTSNDIFCSWRGGEG